MNTTHNALLGHKHDPLKDAERAAIERYITAGDTGKVVTFEGIDVRRCTHEQLVGLVGRMHRNERHRLRPGHLMLDCDW